MSIASDNTLLQVDHTKLERQVSALSSNRPDLLEQLRKVDVILSDGDQDDRTDTSAETNVESVTRSRRLHNRFCLDHSR